MNEGLNLQFNQIDEKIGSLEKNFRSEITDIQNNIKNVDTVKVNIDERGPGLGTASRTFPRRLRPEGGRMSIADFPSRPTFEFRRKCKLKDDQ